MRNFRPVPWIALCACLGACAPFNYVEPDFPRADGAQPVAPPRIALVLGSGGPRGYAHIGVMKSLEQAGIEIDLVVGSSVGALIGVFWGAGYSALELEAIASGGGPLTVFDPSPFADRGWIHGQRLQDFVNDRLQNRTLEGLPRRVIVASTRRSDKAPVFFNAGNAGVAVRASSAMPGIISPVGIDGVEYEDADESLPVAVQAACRAGATLIIAVDVAAQEGDAPADTAVRKLRRDQARRQRIEPELAQADFVVRPVLGYQARPFQSYFVHSQRAGELAGNAVVSAVLTHIRLSGENPGTAFATRHRCRI